MGVVSKHHLHTGRGVQEIPTGVTPLSPSSQIGGAMVHQGKLCMNMVSFQLLRDISEIITDKYCKSTVLSI